MPVILNDGLTVYMPNKAGGNNAVVAAARKSGRGFLESPRNGVDPDLPGRRAMTACEELPRLVSMWQFISRGRMSIESTMVGCTFSQFVAHWLKQRRIDKRPNATNSWYLTIAECRDIVQPEVVVWAEYMDEGLRLLGLDPKDAGVHLDAYRHRRDHLKHFEELSEELRSEILQEFGNI